MLVFKSPGKTDSGSSFLPASVQDAMFGTLLGAGVLVLLWALYENFVVGIKHALPRKIALSALGADMAFLATITAHAAEGKFGPTTAVSYLMVIVFLGAAAIPLMIWSLVVPLVRQDSRLRPRHN